MWDCNNDSGGNRDPTLGQSVSYSTIFLCGDSGVLSSLLGRKYGIELRTQHRLLSR